MRGEAEEMSMDWEMMASMGMEEGLLGGGVDGFNLMYARVMTDDQLEVLRRQISVFATICEQLVEMYKAFTAHHDFRSGMRSGSLYCDPLTSSAIHKVTGRPRWSPTTAQHRILEGIFDRGNGAPSKQKTKEITSELARYGQITEANVYNWFQNKRARMKRKQAAASPSKKGFKPEKIHSLEIHPPRMEDGSFQSPEVGSEACFKVPEAIRRWGMYPLNGSSNPCGSSG